MIRKARAGRYAEERYRRGLRSWRNQTRRTLVFLVPVILAGIVIGMVDRHFLSWFAGMIAGGFIAIGMAAREMTPRYVEKWREGAEGERKTEKILRPFERASWCVVHDVPRRYGNYDHIAAGRPGVYFLETKNLQGIVEIRDGVPRLNRRHDPEEQWDFDRIRPRALSAAAELQREIQQRTGHRTWVQAIVVFWSEFPEGLVEDDKCVFIHGSRLRAWLESRANHFSQSEADEIAAGISAIAEDALAEDAASNLPQPTPA